MVFYNNLYALLILLWSWGDWADDGKTQDEESRSMVNRALAQLVYDYDSIPIVKEVLDKCPYQFYLPGPGVFQVDNVEGCDYLDSAFLPLLTRLLVLFVVYGVGDRNLLEPVIRNLYIELLQNRNRKYLDYSALWSAEGIEVFSIQRAVQALTFYYAYASGKEKVEKRGGLDGNITLRNTTGWPLTLAIGADMQLDTSGPAKRDQIPAEGPAGRHEEPPADLITETNFYDYCRNLIDGWKLDETVLLQHEKIVPFLGKIKELGTTILEHLKEKRILNHGAARVLLNTLARMTLDPEIEGAPREAELAVVSGQLKDLVERSIANTAQKD